MALRELNQNDAGKPKRLELINSVLGEVFGSVVYWNVQKYVKAVEADDH